MAFRAGLSRIEELRSFCAGGMLIQPFPFVGQLGGSQMRGGFVAHLDCFVPVLTRITFLCSKIQPVIRFGVVLIHVVKSVLIRPGA